MRSVDLDFAGHRKGHGSIPGQALFLSTFQPLRLFILLWISCSLSFLEISIHILLVSKTDTGIFIDHGKRFDKCFCLEKYPNSKAIGHLH